MPIKFRWSGSNQHPHYMTGGKAGGLDPQPLHNRDDDAGSRAARKSWRGINMLYADEPHFDNPFYGGGYSWGTAPGTFILMYEPNWGFFAQVWAKYPTWGLRPGDVIEAVHIKEIIDAVDYLINYGVWTTIPICTRKRTPGQYMGYDCGHHYSTHYTSGYGTYGAEYRIGCQKCCANADQCYPYNHVLGYWPLTRGSGKRSKPFGREAADQLVDDLATCAAVLERVLLLPSVSRAGTTSGARATTTSGPSTPTRARRGPRRPALDTPHRAKPDIGFANRLAARAGGASRAWEECTDPCQHV